MQGDLLERLRHADTHSQQRVMGSRIFGEAADHIEALEAWKAEAMEVLRWYADAEPVQLYRDFEIADYQSRARRLVEKEDGRG